MTSTNVKCVLLYGSETGETSGYDECSLSPDDPIFSASPPPIPSIWEIPLVVRQSSPSKQGNLHVTWLMTNPSDGVAPPQWQDGIGDAIVARQDGKDLSSRLLGIVVDYISMLMDAFADGKPHESMFKPANFRKYVLKQDSKLKQSDVRWEVPSDWMPKPSPSPLHQAKALKSTGGSHFASQEFSAARRSYLAARQLITRAYPYERAMEDEEVVELMHILHINIAIASLKLDDPKNSITEAGIATMLHPLADFNKKTKAKAYYTLGSAKLKSMKLGARDLGARSDLLEAKKLAPGDADIARALKEVSELS